MKIAMVAYAFYEGNARIQQYCNALVQRGHTVDVIALRRTSEQPHMNVKGVNVYGVQERVVNETRQVTYLLRILRFLLRSAIVLSKKHRSERYDLVHVHSVPDFLVFAALLPKISGAAVILDIHDILPEFYASKFGANKRSVLFKALVLVEHVSAALSDHVVVANHIWRDRLIARSVQPENCTAVCNYPDPSVFRRLGKTRNNDIFRIIYPGSLNSHQGLDIAIRAFAQVVARAHNAEFHIYGEGPEKPALIELAKTLGLCGKVVFHDSLPLERIAEEIANSDLAVVPKRASSMFGNEAASTKILECMAVGVPLIVSRTKIDTYYHCDQTVKFFESGDDAALAASILELYADPGARAALVRNASMYAQENNWGVKQHIYLEMVDSLIWKKRRYSGDRALGADLSA
jgi:glycosyltransferase involved in cell wall biosynthesis